MTLEEAIDQAKAFQALAEDTASKYLELTTRYYELSSKYATAIDRALAAERVCGTAWAIVNTFKSGYLIRRDLIDEIEAKLRMVKEESWRMK